MQGFLLIRGKTWNFRRKIPTELRPYFNGNREIWRSLGTSEKKVANEACREWVTKTDRVFSFLRSSAKEDFKLEYVKSEIPPSASSFVPIPFPTVDVGLCVSELIEKFVNFKRPDWSLKSQQENEYSLGLFVVLCSDLRLSAIDYETIEDYRKKLSQIPANHTRLKKYKTKTIVELLATPESEKDMPKPDSVNKHLGFFSTMLKFGVQRRYMQYNPAEGIKVKIEDAPDVSSARQKYSNEDLQFILQLLRYDAANPERFYVPLIAMFSGMRRGEICQLYMSDILDDPETGIPLIHVNSGGEKVDYLYKGEVIQLKEKKVKKKDSRRYIPVHPVLWNDLGLSGYVAECRMTGQKRLFQELDFHRDGYGTSFSKWYDDNLAVLVADKGTGKSFHSFRHAFADFFKQTQIGGYDRTMSNEIVKEFIGHAYNKTGEEDVTFERYGKKFPPKTTSTVLFQLDYGLHFDNISEQVGHLIALGGKIDSEKNRNPEYEYPSEDTREQ